MPSSSRSRSPARRPAFAAGLPSMTLWTAAPCSAPMFSSRASVGVTVCVVIPTQAYRTLPSAFSWSIERIAELIGTAKPTPSAVPDVLRI